MVGSSSLWDMLSSGAFGTWATQEEAGHATGMPENGLVEAPGVLSLGTGGGGRHGKTFLGQDVRSPRRSRAES